MGSPKLSAVGSDELAVVERLAVGGMACGACVRHVEAVLGGVPGIRSVRVDLGSATATVRRDPRATSPEALRQAVAEAGYALDSPNLASDVRQAGFPTRPLAFGLLAALGLFGFYLGVITFAQGWNHALQQLVDDRLFVGAIALGFGTQAALFTYLRGLHARTHASVGGIAASTGTSATAMLACCAHHLTEVLPILGLSGAAVFLNAYKAPLLWVGIAMNLAGIAYLLWQIGRQRRMICDPPDAEHDVER